MPLWLAESRFSINLADVHPVPNILMIMDSTKLYLICTPTYTHGWWFYNFLSQLQACCDVFLSFALCRTPGSSLTSISFSATLATTLNHVYTCVRLMHTSPHTLHNTVHASEPILPWRLAWSLSLWWPHHHFPYCCKQCEWARNLTHSPHAQQLFKEICPKQPRSINSDFFTMATLLIFID